MRHLLNTLVALLALTAFSLEASVAALAGEAGPVGGRGGGFFSLEINTKGRRDMVGTIVVNHGPRINGLEFYNQRGRKMAGFGGEAGQRSKFALRPGECLRAVRGTYDHVPQYRSSTITSLQLVTNMGTVSPLFGTESPRGRKFILDAGDGMVIDGIFGFAGAEIDALGIRFRQQKGSPDFGVMEKNKWRLAC